MDGKQSHSPGFLRCFLVKLRTSTVVRVVAGWDVIEVLMACSNRPSLVGGGDHENYAARRDASVLVEEMKLLQALYVSATAITFPKLPRRDVGVGGPGERVVEFVIATSANTAKGRT